MASRYRLGPIFTPPVVSRREGPLGTFIRPSRTNWPGGAYDPETRILYVPSSAAFSALGLVPPAPGQSDLEYIQGNAITGPRRTAGAGSQVGGGQRVVSGRGGGASGNARTTVRGLPLLKPPWGRISAIDMDRGEILWQIPHGETPDFVRHHPALAGLDIPRTGRTGAPGVLVTKTLVISGEMGYFRTPSGRRGAMLRAYDKASGAEVGAVYMPAPQSGSPMTYMHDGRQYLVVAVSGGNYSGELLAFRLPAQS